MSGPPSRAIAASLPSCPTFGLLMFALSCAGLRMVLQTYRRRTVFPSEMLFQGRGPVHSASQSIKPRCVELFRKASIGPATALPPFSRKLTSRFVAAGSKGQHAALSSHQPASHELSRRAALASLLGRQSCCIHLLMLGVRLVLSMIKLYTAGMIEGCHMQAFSRWPALPLLQIQAHL